jgi:NAD(P)-dependent dehydrogenase (short-subunit alcohol dehydrogenase family)
MDLKDRVVVVTGGGSGIGEALARAAGDAGARHVVVADRDREQADRVAADIGGSAAAIDVGREDQVRRLVDKVENDNGPIDLFCSNAGFVTTAGLEESNETIETMWQVHVMAHVYAARAVIPSMIARGEGYLLNTASAAGLLTQVGSMAYAVTKHAAVALAEWLAITHHHQGIRVSVLCPQAVRTNIVANSPSYQRGSDEAGLGVAAADGILEADAVAALCLEAIAAERFLVLPHQEVASYVERTADDIDRWLAGKPRFQDKLNGEGPLPGDAMAPR